ncbi:MAG TPA: CNP1-like family protein [Ottowia sp.]|uniref:CNP1-like family protein n=1 Tax=Ottowia sp. TaxID=1898956 RepID=UPI002C4DBEAC|nr:CNP1-like family protein [Ottowia sp.]MCZ2089275.1 CNP1-like family protein [Burkholderiales bacterium]HNE60564.1 CNP1-like family protein [Ottowia sp.]HNI84392.1 CNP1-like family protein [Ottowia sp.]HNJ46163.1 CNP1-like family protein [Ottowia sp.]HNL40931.1 CNP1-like family protein [Ottowia sp.]
MSRRLRPPGRRAWLACLLAACAGLFSAPGAAQYADLDRADWQEDPVPPPPAYSLERLLEIDMPKTASVRMGIDPQTLSVNHQSGVVRYVVVARGTSAVNASYEGIRCTTGEFRVYARQVQGGEWTPSTDSGWKSMRGQSSVLVQHPLRLARDGLCLGPSARQTVSEMVRELKTGNRSLYY